MRRNCSHLQKFKLRAVFEGGETIEQLEAIKGLGCRYAQGYYFNKYLKNNIY